MPSIEAAATQERESLFRIRPQACGFRVRILSFLVCTPLALGGCGDSPLEPEDRFPLAEAQGINAPALVAAFDNGAAIPGLRSLLVQRHGTLVAEEYFHGHHRDSLLHVFSVTKSVTSILVGIAVDRDEIGGINETLRQHLVSLVDSLDGPKGDISIEHLLTMSGGFEGDELADLNVYNDWVQHDDHLQYILDQPLVNPPGSQWVYNTPACQLLSPILTQATGQLMKSYGRENLFEPLGIALRSWRIDNRGYTTAGVGLYLRARDMMRFGQMVLDGGVWKGRRIVSETWLEEATLEHFPTNRSPVYGSGYGYLWWVGRAQGHDFFFASGYAGQLIVVFPGLDLVVVAQSAMQSENEANNAQWMEVFNVLVNDVLAAVGK